MDLLDKHKKDTWHALSVVIFHIELSWILMYKYMPSCKSHSPIRLNRKYLGLGVYFNTDFELWVRELALTTICISAISRHSIGHFSFFLQGLNDLPPDSHSSDSVNVLKLNAKHFSELFPTWYYRHSYICYSFLVLPPGTWRTDDKSGLDCIWLCMGLQWIRQKGTRSSPCFLKHPGKGQTQETLSALI